MKIKYSPKPNIFKALLGFFRQQLKTKLGIILLVAIIISSSGFVVLKKKGYIEKFTRVIPYIIHGYIVNPPERLVIDMKFKHYQKLAHKAKEAVDFGFLVKEADDEVPAYITYKGKKVRVKTRLKGGMKDHHIGRKWSLRIQVKGDETIMGMKQFSIQRPLTRWYLNEWLYHQILRREKIMTLRYSFINVTLNGKDLGLYAVEEHFGKELIENNQHREGLIIRWDDEDFFLSNTSQYKSPLIAGAHTIGYFSSPVRTYGLNKGGNTNVKMDQFKTAMELFHRLRTGEIELTDAYDLKKTARYFALNDLLGARHGSLYPNFVTYYNPVTGKLEPVGFDTEDAMHSVKILSGERFMKLFEEQKVFGGFIKDELFDLWKEEKFAEEYLKELQRISQVKYIDELINEIKGPAKDAIGHLWNLGIEGIRSQSFKFVENQLHFNAKTIRGKLKNIKGVYAYFVSAQGGKLLLKMGNPDTLPIEILHISYKDRVVARYKNQKHLVPRKFFEPIQFQRFEFSIEDKFQYEKSLLSDMRVVYQLPGTTIKKEQLIFPWNILDDDFFANDFIRQKPNFRSFEFLGIDEEKKTITMQKGQWVLENNMIIPAGWTVLAFSGVVLDLINEAKILSYSPLRFVGDEELPIRIISSNSTGQGLIVMNAEETSLLRHVTFENLSNPKSGGWSLTGAVTFYESNVNIEHCHFLASRSEDSLNIIRSNFSIESTFFKDSASDAIDFDFARGKVTNSSFYNSGNDAIDFSGSHIELSKIFINKAGDKGISIGEASDIILNDIEIHETKIALAHKDSSSATVNNLSIHNAVQAIALYQKKPEFSFSNLIVNGIELKGVDTPYSVEKWSTLIIDGKSIKTDQ